MLSFNCTQAACDFFSKVHKGKKINPVQKSLSQECENDDLYSDPHQWLVHAATVQRKHVLLAIHLKTRYCMLFFDMKKADADGFVHAFINRWTSGVLGLALKSDVLDLVDPSVPEQQFVSLVESYCLLQRGDRSAQTQLNEILRNFKLDAEGIDLAAASWSALHYDAQINHTPRSLKDVKGLHWPDEEMVIHWLVTVGGLDPAGAALAREKYGLFRRMA